MSGLLGIVARNPVFRLDDSQKSMHTILNSQSTFVISRLRDRNIPLLRGGV